MATTYKTAYEAVADGLRGDELTDYELADTYQCGTLSRSIVRSIRDLTRMERGCEVFVTVNVATGIDIYFDEEMARKWSEGIHPGNRPSLNKVVRNSRGYRVEPMAFKVREH